jgi:hypothetical protein
LIIGLKPDAPVVETGFAKQLLLFASYPECKKIDDFLFSKFISHLI